MEAYQELEKQRKQYESVKGKNPQFRVEYRFPRGSRHYMYFLNYEDAKKFEFVAVNFPPIGLRLYKQHPLSKQIQRCGPRGGWISLKNYD